MPPSSARSLRPWAGVLASAALALTPLAVGGWHAAAAADSVSTGGTCTTSLISASFDDQSLDGLIQDGGPSSLTYEHVGSDTGYALRVDGRSSDYFGVQTAAGALSSLTAGETVTVTARVRLATSTSATTSARMVAVPGYGWIGNQSGVSDSAWTTIGGTYTIPSGTDTSKLQFYVGTDSLTDGTTSYDYDIDDVTVSVPGTDCTGSGDTGSTGTTGGSTCTYPTSNPVISSGFEDGTTDGWTGRDDGHGTATLSVASGGDNSSKALEATNRAGQGQGVGYDVTCVLQPGVTYEFSGDVRFAAGQPTDEVWLSLANTAGGSTTYTTLGQFTGVSNSGWTHVDQKFTMPAQSDSALLYLETKYYSDGSAGNTSDLLFDNLQVAQPAALTVQDITPIKDTLPFPVGAAVSDPELTGAAGQLVAKHFDQLTPENSMKPESWYNADHSFVTTNADADELMSFAQQNKMRVYGHNLVWYQQTPDWFFQDAQGNWLTNSAADQATLRQRLHDHIFAVAKYLSDKFGAFGSSTNPLVSFDVVNEAVSDNAGDPDGLRQSHWYQVLGESYIEDAFNDANEAFNQTYAAADASHPIQLFLNDYNTEESGKRGRMLDLVKRLIADNVPIDGVGHQFHVTMSTPLSSLRDAIEAFQGIQTADGHELDQAVTELDVPTGTPVTQANEINQGYYYQGIFDMLRQEYAADPDIFSATLWGVYDSQSWRSDEGAPLLFDDDLQAKPAYYGVTDQPLPPKQLTAVVFQQDGSDVDAGAADATSNVEWSQLPLQPVGDDAGFQLRWSSDHLTAYVSSTDATKDATDAATLQWTDGGQTSTATVKRDGTVTGNGVSAKVTDTTSGWSAVVDLPSAGLTASSTPSFDVAVTDGTTTTDWNTPGNLGTLQLVEPLSFTTIPEATTAPEVDGTKDAVWDQASTVSTDKVISGDPNGAKATVYQLWKDNYLYVLAEVTDPTIDLSSPNAYEQDSVEIFTDPGNAKNGSYRPDDAQMRINADNVVSYGTGDETDQAARLTSATSRTATGYIVEARIDLKDGNTGVGSFEGVDYEVNDGTNGARTSDHGWAEPTGAAYETTARWGVAELTGPPTTAVPLTVTGPGIGAVRKVTGGSPVRLQYTAKGASGALTWTAKGLPVGLRLTRAGVVEGTTSEAGTFPAKITVRDASGASATTTASIVVVAPKPSIRRVTVPVGHVHRRFTATLRVRGASLRWTHGRLPRGLKVTTSDFGTVVRVTGKPARAGRYAVALHGRDAAGHRLTRTIHIVVR